MNELEKLWFSLVCKSIIYFVILFLVSGYFVYSQSHIYEYVNSKISWVSPPIIFLVSAVLLLFLFFKMLAHLCSSFWTSIPVEKIQKYLSEETIGYVLESVRNEPRKLGFEPEKVFSLDCLGKVIDNLRLQISSDRVYEYRGHKKSEMPIVLNVGDMKGKYEK